MNSHLDFDLLSAFVDGDIDDAERARIEAHLPSCASCSEILGALRATLADLAALDVPEPTDQDSWALRSALAAARTAEKSRRYPRYVIAAAGVAASIVAVAALATSGDKPTFSTTGVPKEAVGMSAERSDQNFTEASARDLLGGTLEQRRVFATKSYSSSADTAAPGSAPSVVGPQGAPNSAVSTCRSTVAPRDGALKDSFQARFKNRKAYFFIFAVPSEHPTRLELWVTSATSTCDTLFFAQRSLSK